MKKVSVADLSKRELKSLRRALARSKRERTIGHLDVPFDASTCAAPAPQALRFNKGKPIISRILCFPAALAGIAKVTEFGERKYAKYNFLKGAPESEHLDCLLRHVIYKWCRVDLDGESGLDHSNALAWNAMRYADETQRKPAGYVDDRPPAGTFDPEQIIAMLTGGFEGQTLPLQVLDGQHRFQALEVAALTAAEPLTDTKRPAKVKSRRRSKR